MDQVWESFAAQMGENRAFISFNQSYAEIAKTDKRNVLLQVRTVIKKPTAAGLPTNEEFPQLVRVEDSLTEGVEANGGVQVGRLTVNGQRYFSFYVSFPEATADLLVTKVAKETKYNLQYAYSQDPAKDGYWKELYPTEDDWQVIRDIKVLDSLSRNGDKQDKAREVSHWAYFFSQQNAQKFADWANANHYKVVGIDPNVDKKKVEVRFTHVGTMDLADITSRTIAANRKAVELGGEYDGWETSVEKQ